MLDTVKINHVQHISFTQSRLTDAVSVILSELLSYEHPSKRRGVHHNSTRSPRKVNRLTGLKRCGVSVKVGMWVKVPANRSL